VTYQPIWKSRSSGLPGGKSGNPVGYQGFQKIVGPCLWHFDIDVVFSCFDWNLCYSLYIDKVMCLESMLDKVTVTAICQKFFSIVDALW